MMEHSYLSGDGIYLDRENFGQGWDFRLPVGQWTSLIGASGAGKSTLLEVIAGFQALKAGRITFANKLISSLPVAKRNIAYLFQESSLFPSLDVSENLQLAMHDRNFSKSEKMARIASVLCDLELQDKKHVYPRNLSGGEKARVELARSLLRGCDVLLLDEPFAALDSRLRRQMLILLRKMQKKLGLTVICVSHNPEDCYLVADHVIAMARGQILISKSLRQTIESPQYQEVVELLQLGFVSQQGDGVWFVPQGALYSSPNIKTSGINLSKRHAAEPMTHDVQSGAKLSTELKELNQNDSEKSPLECQSNLESVNFSENPAGDDFAPKKLRSFTLQDFAVIHTPTGRALLDMETGVEYAQSTPNPEGKFYFFEEQCQKIR